MDQRNYSAMLLRRVEKTFSEWREKEFITERELYLFLHMLKGTSGTIGMDALSTFCSSQLEILSSENESKMPVHALEKFIKRIRSFLDGTGEEGRLLFREGYNNRFTEETFVLIIDDDLEFVTYVKDLLEKMGAQVIVALNGKNGIEKFYAMRPNFVLIDLMLPDMSGFEILDQIKDTANARQVTMAIISVDNSRENRIKAYERGAMDFIIKPIDVEIFIPYLFNRHEIRKTVAKSIVTDGLTGVGNRRHFDERIQYFAETYNRSGITFSFVMLDLDHFKQVNDVYGHPMGDEVLRKLGKVMMEEKRGLDNVFRYGGEEFAFLLSGSTAEETIGFVERLRNKFNAIVFQQDDRQFSVTFSAGIATYEGDIKKLVSSADQALYEAKRTGRNRTVIFDGQKVHVRRKLNIIIVDDDALIRAMLQEKLMKWTIADIDITVHDFSDGPTFLEAEWYSPEEYYIILLDGIMPGMDGLEVLSRLKSVRDEKNVMVSMLTARATDADVKAALWLGADDYIMKPFKSKDVFLRIQQMANRLFNHMIGG